MYYQGGVYVITSTQLDLAFMYAGRGLDSLAYRPASWYHGKTPKKGPETNFYIKVHILWKGHKIFRNLHLNFVLCCASQKLGEDFEKFYGLLRIYELYLLRLIFLVPLSTTIWVLSTYILLKKSDFIVWVVKWPKSTQKF